MLIFIWGPMVFLGVLLGLALQAVIAAHLHLSVGCTFIPLGLGVAVYRRRLSGADTPS